jgi:hypothetical protein
MAFIELPGLWLQPDHNEELFSMGSEIEFDESPVLVNTDNITSVNSAVNKNHTTIRFLSETIRVNLSYENVVKLIQESN